MRVSGPVQRAPDKIVAEARKHGAAGAVVAARGGDPALCVVGAVALHGARHQVCGADEERRRGRGPRPAPDRQRDAQQQHQREERVDD